MSKINNLVGQKFGKLRVIAYVGKSKSKMAKWKCRCTCGKETIVFGRNLRCRTTVSCGCKRQDFAKTRRTIRYRYRGKQLAYAYTSIRTRCNNPNSHKYPRYGGRGIKCEWDTFEDFLKDNLRKFNYAKKKYLNEKLSIERKDVNGNYNKKNVTWIPMRDQAKNTTKNHRLTFQKKTMNIADWPRTEWCKKLNIKRCNVHSRLRAGWSIEKTLTTPVRKINNS